MRNVLIPVFWIFMITVSLTATAQTGYKLQFKVDGWKDTTAYLGHYYGESTYLKDTAKVNATGQFVFDGKKELAQGVYFLVLNKTKIFEFLVGKNQHFTLDTKAEDYVKFMKVVSDNDNKIFFENMVFNMERHKEAEPFLKVIQDSTLTEDKKKSAREGFSKVNEKVTAYQQSVIDKNPGSLVAALFKANMPIRVPEAPRKPNGGIDSTFQLRWYREHFFDNFDLSNDALIRLPRSLYAEKINEYLDKLWAPQPDTIKKAITFIASKAKKNQETYKYSLWICLLKYQQPEIMGLDAVYVDVFDTYYASGEMNFWVTPSLMKNLKEHADRLRKSLIGKPAPNLIMQDANLKPRSMHDLKNKYTILFIFDPDCGHCKTETPKLVEFYNKNKAKFDIEVFAVSADTSIAKMRDFAKQFKTPWITVNGPRTYVGPYSDLYDSQTTPSIYIIDEKKKIIAKKPPIEKLEEFFTNYEKFIKKG